jgi:hypothetical protein
MLRATFGTLSEEFAATMVGKLISGLRPNPYDLLGETTLNAALATVASLRPESEIDALMCVEIVIAGFSALRMLELSQRQPHASRPNGTGGTSQSVRGEDQVGCLKR